MAPLLLAFFAGLIAGTMNALAGGGSFVSLPALIAAGVPSVQANASSTVALFPGGAASVWAYRDSLGSVGSASLRLLLAATLIGGAVGGLLLLYTPTKEFDLILPWLLLIALAALACGRRIGDWLRRRWKIRPGAVAIIQFCLGIYGGYFGGAVGIMMIAAWGLLDDCDLRRLNGTRTLMVSTANAIAVIIFITTRLVRWPPTVALLIGGILGGYCGALIGRRAPPHVIRVATLIITTLITVAFFVKLI